jgi:hypothetical protein
MGVGMDDGLDNGLDGGMNGAMDGGMNDGMNDGMDDGMNDVITHASHRSRMFAKEEPKNRDRGNKRFGACLPCQPSPGPST